MDSWLFGLVKETVSKLAEVIATVAVSEFFNAVWPDGYEIEPNVSVGYRLLHLISANRSCTPPPVFVSLVFPYAPDASLALARAGRSTDVVPLFATMPVTEKDVEDEKVKTEF
jgi:hypothetical protein